MSRAEVMRPRWMKEMVNAPAEERGTSAAPHFAPHMRPIRWWVSAEDAQRVADLMACWQCTKPFPCPPCPENLRRWKREAPELLDWHPTIPMIGEERVRNRCCPYCDSECTPEMVRLMLDFTPGGPQRPGAPNYLTDRDYEKLPRLDP